MPGLLNKFILWDRGDTYQSGKITCKISDEVYVFRADPVGVGGGGPPVSLCFAVPVVWDELFIFDTRAELDAFLAWLETPSETPRVVNFEKKKP